MNKLSPCHLFKWKGINKNGKAYRGYSFTETKEQLEIILKQKSIFIISSYIIPIWFLKNIATPIKKHHIIEITSQLAQLLQAGLPLSKSLNMLAESAALISLKHLLYHLEYLIHSGEKFSTSCAYYPKYFNNAYINLMKAGELTGKFDYVLLSISSEQEEHSKILKNIKKTLRYPCIVLVVALIITSMLITNILPELQKLYQSFNSHLPWLTHQLLALHELIQKQTLIDYLLIIIIIRLVFLYIKKVISIPFIQKKLYNTPMIHTIYKKFMLYSFFRIFSLGYNSGLSILDTIEITSNTYQNPIFNHYCSQIKKALIDGTTLHKAIINTTLFPPLAHNLVHMGEETGGLDKNLEQLHHIYKSEFNDLLEMLSQWIEPIMMIFIALLIGTIIIGMYLPIFQLTDVIN